MKFEVGGIFIGPYGNYIIIAIDNDIISTRRIDNGICSQSSRTSLIQFLERNYYKYISLSERIERVLNEV